MDLMESRKRIDEIDSEMVRLLAAKDVLDRAGFRPDDNVNANIDTDLHITIDYGD